MRLSTALDHAYMIRRGWNHEALCAMSEDEFLDWLEATIDLDVEFSEAAKRAMEDPDSS